MWSMNEVKGTFAFKFNVTNETLLGFLLAVAVSNNAKGVMGPPKYDDAKFDIKDNVTAVEVKICY